MAGHSAWKNIKHKKAISDAKKGKAWSKCMRTVITAARLGGGNPEANLTLKMAIEEARIHNVPKDTIEKGIKRGTGDLAGQGEQYESAVYEGYGPGGVAILLEILTNNRQRTAPEIKNILEDAGGNLGSTGCVAYIFQTRGQVLVSRKNVPEETIMTIALEGGAEDVIDSGEEWQVLCEPANLMNVRQVILNAKLPIESAGLTRLPTMTVPVTGETARTMLALIEELDDHDDVQKVYANFEIPDAELDSLK